MIPLLALVLFLAAGSYPSQDAPLVEVSPAEAVLRLEAAPIIYPPLAQAARVEGIVTMRVQIGLDGRVEGALITRSIPLLDQSALDSIRRWHFRPFTAGGQPLVVHTDIDVPFVLRPEGKELDVFLGLEHQCVTLAGQKALEEAERACATASDAARKLAFVRARRRADMYVVYGAVLALRGKPADAIEPLKAAAKAYEDGWAAGREAGAAQRALGSAYLATGDAKNARRSFEKAESLLARARKALSQLEARDPMTEQLRTGLLAGVEREIRDTRAAFDACCR